MISSSQIKLIRSLQMKKQRDRQRLYTVEGSKMVLDLIKGSEYTDHRPSMLFATEDWINGHSALLGPMMDRVIPGTEKELRKISNLVTPQPVICLVAMPEKSEQETKVPGGPVLVFESIRDPGNLGTIMRTANWFGISHLVCSPDSVDQFNPKVVQATMGAIFRVEVFYRELEDWLSKMGKVQRRILGTFLEGENIYRADLGEEPVILFGNESHGLSNRFDRYLQGKIAVPQFFSEGKGPESLNVASTVAIVCSEIRREGMQAPIRSGN
ncbi:MAG: TrmH family RNA methyltransferase [Bacteroidales bacterium]